MSLILGPISCRYVFVDVVAYSRRPVEAQTDVIASLNEIVKEASQELGIQGGSSLLLPTGDGICIAIGQFDSSAIAATYDAHLQLATLVLKGIHSANDSQPAESRKYSVRVGVNENIDNVIVDINGQQNVAGAGINMCQRIMSAAGSSQILIGRSVYDVLHSREKYALHAFRTFRLEAKHAEQIDVYQYLGTGDEAWLESNIPPAFSANAVSVPALDLRIASHIVEADIYRDDFLERVKRGDTGAIGDALIALWLRSQDWETRLGSGTFDSRKYYSDGFPDRDLLSYASAIAKVPFPVRWELRSFIEHKLQRYRPYFETASEWFVFPTRNAVAQAATLISSYGDDPRKFKEQLQTKRRENLDRGFKALETVAEAFAKLDE